MAVAALRQVGRWQPGRLPAFAGAVPVGEPMPAVGSLRASFTPKYGLLVQPVSWSLPRTRLPRARRLRHLNDSLLAQPAFRQRYWQAQDSLAYLRMLATQARLLAGQARLRAQFTDTARTAITQDGVYNELQTQGLGWINCDRFAGQGKILFTYKVAPRQPDAIVSLVFRDMRSVLQGRPQPNELVAFANAPLGQAATVVALRRQDGVTYLARRDVRVGLATLTKLDFHPVTMAELRTELATLR